MTTSRPKLVLSSPKTVGVIVMAVLLAFSLFAFNRAKVQTTLASGEPLSAEFRQDYKLVPHESVVKLAGVEVGKVTGVEQADGNAAKVVMKLDDGTLDKLGTQPKANIRPTLVLGGKYYVELVQGGKDGAAAEGATIPAKRTTVPVELDKVLSAVTPEATESVRGTVGSLEKTLDRGGQREVGELLDSAPAALEPTSQVLGALRGNQPSTDLTRLVTGLNATATELTRERGQLVTIIDDLSVTTTALADHREAISGTLDQAPETLRVTETGLADLDGTLDRLRTTAEDFRPAARELEPTLRELDGVLVTARPVIADARVVAHDARPLVEDLRPGVSRATSVLEDIEGPVVERLDGPLKKAVLSPWHGTGVYEGGGNDHPLYKEVGYLLSDTADVFKYHDKNGAHGRLMAGVGLSTPGGIIGHSIEQYLELLGYQLPAGPQEGANQGEPAPPLGSSPSHSDGALGSAPEGPSELTLPLVPRSER